MRSRPIYGLRSSATYANRVPRRQNTIATKGAQQWRKTVSGWHRPRGLRALRRRSPLARTPVVDVTQGPGTGLISCGAPDEGLWYGTREPWWSPSLNVRVGGCRAVLRDWPTGNLHAGPAAMRGRVTHKAGVGCRAAAGDTARRHFSARPEHRPPRRALPSVTPPPNSVGGQVGGASGGSPLRRHACGAQPPCPYPPGRQWPSRHTLAGGGG